MSRKPTRSYNNPTVDWKYIDKHVKGAALAWRIGVGIPDEEIRGGLTGRPPRAIVFDRDWWTLPPETRRYWEFNPATKKWEQVAPKTNA